MRINGEIYEIDKWFDNIIGTNGKYKELNKILVEVYSLETVLSKKKMFKKSAINKIRNKSIEIMMIIKEFNKNVNFK